jgi:hypothetical protein
VRGGCGIPGCAGLLLTLPDDQPGNTALARKRRTTSHLAGHGPAGTPARHLAGRPGAAEPVSCESARPGPSRYGSVCACLPSAGRRYG